MSLPINEKGKVKMPYEIKALKARLCASIRTNVYISYSPYKAAKLLNSLDMIWPPDVTPKYANYNLKDLRK